MVPHARPAAYHTVLIVQRIWRDEVKVLITYLRTEALAQVSSEFRSVVELVQVEVIRFTHKLNCFDGSVSHSWI